MANDSIRAKRPLSPHLTIHKPIPTMVMSIFHRITGMGLYSGTPPLAWWLMAAASGPAYFDWVNGFFGSWLQCSSPYRLFLGADPPARR